MIRTDGFFFHHPVFLLTYFCEAFKKRSKISTISWIIGLLKSLNLRSMQSQKFSHIIIDRFEQLNKFSKTSLMLEVKNHFYLPQH